MAEESLNLIKTINSEIQEAKEYMVKKKNNEEKYIKIHHNQVV